MFILDSITPGESKENGAGQTKNTESENPGTHEDINDVSTFHFIKYKYLSISIYFDMEWNLQLSKSNS